MRHANDRVLASAPTTSGDLLRLVVDSGRALLEGQVAPLTAPAASNAAPDTHTVAAAPHATMPASRDTLVRIVLIGAATFIAYKALRNVKSLAWTLFGLAMMWSWIGGARWW